MVVVKRVMQFDREQGAALETDVFLGLENRGVRFPDFGPYRPAIVVARDCRLDIPIRLIEVRVGVLQLDRLRRALTVARSGRERRSTGARERVAWNTHE